MKKMKQVSPSDALIDEWLKHGRKPEDVQGLLRQFTKQVVERASRIMHRNTSILARCATVPMVMYSCG